MTAELALITDILVRSTPLVLTGLAVSVGFQGGLLNIGAEGQLLAGASVAAAISSIFSNALGVLTVPVALICAIAAGALWAGIAALMRNKFHVMEVISTIMLNFVALYMVSYLVRGPLQEPTHIYPQSETIPTFAQLPRIIPGTRLHIGFLVAVVLGVALWWFIMHTAAGFRLRATGANPIAAWSVGKIDTGSVTAKAFLMSGAIAGLAGGVELSGVSFALYENLSPGYGYIALAVALLARFNPLWVIVTGIIFGALESGAIVLQRDAGIPSTLALVAEAVMILVMVAVDKRRHGGDGGART